MATVKLSTGVLLSSDNESIIQQYLKYGAVEVKDEPKKTVDDAPKKISNKGRKAENN